MLKVTKYQQVFFELVRAGLWEKEVRLLPFGEVDYAQVLQLAEEQSVIGLVAAGLEHVIDTKLQQNDLLQFISQTIQIEQRNAAMNHFIGVTVKQMRNNGIESLLVKGQGVARCYERPLWRSSGDIDFLFDGFNYSKALDFLAPKAEIVDKEDNRKLHIAMGIGHWEIELHGSLRGLLWKSLDNKIDELQKEAFANKRCRVWNNDGVEVLLPNPNDDAVFIFTHILQHYFKSGIGIRQICDWCRLLWTYRKDIDLTLLESRLKRMGVMTEWKAFAAFAVDVLGMPSEAMPLYVSTTHWSHKAKRMLSYILETGNFGHNRDTEYINTAPFIIRKLISFWRHTKDGIRHFMVFPRDSIKVWICLIKNGI